VGTIHVKGRWYQVYHLEVATRLVIDQLKRSLNVLSSSNIEVGHKTYGSIMLIPTFEKKTYALASQ
jgi:hypothetical protein